MKIARVFPRKTTASPTDPLAFFGDPPENLEVDEVHVSCTFTYDRDKAEEMATAWQSVAPVKVGGPAYDDPGGEFVPGRYIAPGYVFTSRGCPNKCWYCTVNKREGNVRELPIRGGHNVLDSNILACSRDHILKVFTMLSLQEKPVEFTGGLDAALLTPWHVAQLWELRPSQMFFAYDKPIDLGPLREAGEMLRYANFTRRHLRCYVLIGWEMDTIPRATERLHEAWEAGFMPMAMLWKPESGEEDKEWRQLQRLWARPALTKKIIKNGYDVAYGEN